jgi:hypothetical protein
MLSTLPPPLPLPAVKLCRLCHQEKPIADFAKRTRSRDGHQAHCKPCGRQALDAADARRRAEARPRPTPARSVTLLEDLFVAHVDTVAQVLVDVAFDGAADVLSRLADALCPRCPDAAAEEGDDLTCEIHDLANIHAQELLARVPEAVRAMDPAWQHLYAAPASGNRTEG